MAGRGSQLSICNWEEKKSLDVIDSKGRISVYPPPRVFLRKSVDLLDSKGVGVFQNDKEFVI